MSASEEKKPPQVHFLLWGVIPAKHVHLTLLKGETLGQAMKRQGIELVHRVPAK